MAKKPKTVRRPKPHPAKASPKKPPAKRPKPQPFDPAPLQKIYGRLDQVVKVTAEENIFRITTKGGKTLAMRNLVFVHHADVTLLEAYGKLLFIDPRIIPNPFSKEK